MKHLTLIRHAKSSHDQPGLTDFQRGLDERGRRDAPAMGRYLASVRFHPDAVVSSPAVRALTTARVIAGEIAFDLYGIVEEPRIYEAPVEQLIQVVQELEDRWQHVALFGHNPGFEDLTNRLCGTRAVEGLKTTGVVRLELKIDAWREAGPGSARLVEYLYPALLNGRK